jgi:hypothetical protein
MHCPAQDEEYEAGDTSDLLLDRGGTVSFTQSSIYLGSLPHRDLSDHHYVNTRIKKASKAELELELIQIQMAPKPMLRAEVGMRVRCANKASAE